VARAESGYRTYRVSRIADLALLDGRFERPEDFDLAAYWERSVAAYQGSLPSFVAVLRVRGEAVERFPEAVGPGPARQALSAGGRPDLDGWLTVQLPLEDVWHAVAQVLALGAEAQVIEPAELRDAVAAAARAIAARYV
jgi:predicted DNA-binding transcriptional regulator YafY